MVLPPHGKVAEGQETKVVAEGQETMTPYPSIRGVAQRRARMAKELPQSLGWPDVKSAPPGTVAQIEQLRLIQ
jgi:hypothetical protein